MKATEVAELHADIDFTRQRQDLNLPFQ